MKIFVTDNIMYKGHKCSAASKTLSDFVAPYSAVIIEKLLSKGARIEIKPCPAEFAIGGISTATKKGFILKPTHDSIDRHGIIAASCLEQITITCDTAKECFDIFNIIKSQVTNAPPLPKSKLEPIDPTAISSLNFALDAYYTILAAETASNFAKFDGVRYTTKGFSDSLKQRIDFGNSVLSKEHIATKFAKAKQIQASLKSEFDTLFKKCDAVVTPNSDAFIASASLAGLPTIVTPDGVQIIGRPNGEKIISEVLNGKI